MKTFWTRPIWIVIAVLLLLGLLLGVLSQYQRVNWERSYTKKSQQPFGTRLLWEQMGHLFPQSEVVEADARSFDILAFRRRQHSLYIFINQKLPFYPESTRELLRFVAAGNHAFLATEAIPEELEKALGVQGASFSTLRDPLKAYQLSGDSTSLSIQDGDAYRFPRRDAERSWGLIDLDEGLTVLGQHEGDKANFLRIDYGAGQFWLYSHPNLLGNYYVLDSTRRPYIEQLLHELPAADTVLWDSYYKAANLRFRPDRRRDDQTPDNPERPSLIAYMLSQPALAWALGLAALGMLLYILTEVKRKQRVIPTLEPLPNTTLDFAETIGRLYFQRRDHRHLMQKRSRALLDHVRRAYYLPTHTLDAAFVHALAAKSGLDEEALKDLVDSLAHLDTADALTESELIELNRGIEWFYAEGAR